MAGLRGAAIALGTLTLLSLVAGALALAASEPFVALLCFLIAASLLLVLARERRTNTAAARESRTAVAAMRRISTGDSMSGRESSPPPR